MPVLTRSVTFRSPGSSGLVWDDGFFLGDKDRMMNNNASRHDGRNDGFRGLRSARSTGFISNKMDSCQSNYNNQINCTSSGLEPSLPKASKRAVVGILKKSMSASAARPPKVSSR